MPLNKYTFFFTQNNQGWSESWYNLTSGSVPNPNQNAAFINQYAVYRRVFLTNTAILTYARYSLIGPYSTQGQKNSYVTEIGNVGNDRSGDNTFAAVLYRIYDPTLQHVKNWYCRGVNDALFTNGGQFVSVNGFTKNVNDFFAAMSQFQMGWLGTLGGVQYPVATCVQNAANSWVNLTFNVNPATGFFPFTPYPVGYRLQVRLTGLRGCPNLNGQITLIVQSPSSARTEDVIAIFPYQVGSGYLMTAPKTVYQVSTADAYRGVERRPGRPSYQSRGRRSVTSRGR
jgi:enamine deaminase RidA (YjgF/YER057c/UK114 family)